ALGQARHPSKRTAGPTDRFHLHLRCSLPEGGQGCSPDHAGLQHRGDELAPRRDRRNRRARCPRHPPGRSSRLALVHPSPRAGQYHHHSAAAEVPRAQPGRERLAVHARQLALQPHLQILRRSRRPLLCGMEQARRSALAHHVHRTAPMGPRVLINGIWYEFLPALNFREITTVSRHAIDQPRWGGSGQKNRRHKQIAGGVMGSVVMGASLRKSIIVAAVVLTGAAGLPVRAAEPTAAGLWEQVDDNTGKPESWFKITERNGVYVGNLVKIFFKPGEDENWVCDRCEGAEKGVPVLGLALIKGMRRNGYSYENGTILDPRDGSVYRALMRLSPDGSKLEVRGYLGISLFGRTQVWNRLPDNALSSQSAPPAPKGAGAAQKK